MKAYLLPILLCLSPLTAYAADGETAASPKAAMYKDYRGREHDILKEPATVYALLACDMAVAVKMHELEDEDTRMKAALIADALAEQVEPVALGAAIDTYGAAKAVSLPDQRQRMMETVERSAQEQHGDDANMGAFTDVCYQQASVFGASLGD
jgi:hypothetical protein